MPAMADWSCPPSLNALSMTLISVAVVSSPVKAVQSACERSQTQFLSLLVRMLRGKRTVDDEACADDVASAVHGSCLPREEGSQPVCVRAQKKRERERTDDEGDLEQTRELVLVLDARLGVDEGALVAYPAVTPDEDVVGNGLPEDFDLEDVGDDLFGLAVNVGVDEGDIVVAGDDVAEGRQAFLDALDGDLLGQRVADVLQFLVRGRVGDEQAVAVAGDEAADDAGAADRGLHDGDDVSEFGLERRDKVGRAGAGRREAVAVGQHAKDTDLRAGQGRANRQCLLGRACVACTGCRDALRLTSFHSGHLHRVAVSE